MQSFSFGGKIGWQKMEASVNYNRITSNGRYLMPGNGARILFSLSCQEIEMKDSEM